MQNTVNYILIELRRAPRGRDDGHAVPHGYGEQEQWIAQVAPGKLEPATARELYSPTADEWQARGGDSRSLFWETAP